jgi:hypothetical protein
VPQTRNADLDLRIDELLLKAGARIGERERLAYYGRPIIAEDDLPLHTPVAASERLQDLTQNHTLPTGTLPNTEH